MIVKCSGMKGSAPIPKKIELQQELLNLSFFGLRLTLRLVRSSKSSAFAARVNHESTAKVNPSVTGV